MRRSVTWGIIRAIGTIILLVGLYFLGPLDEAQKVPLPISLAVAGVLLLAISALEIRAITKSRHPEIRGVQALAVTVPLYLLLFSSAYFLMAADDPGSFEREIVTRLDALYYTVAVFASVGFGDIAALSQQTRMLVTIQMILNLLVLGAGIRVFIGAARRSRGAGRSSPPK
ncbi:hypothetical protein ASD65_08505 [Microbacterium sp. Root61]|nr:hypothetical protein ASD65_08505 [Microbacterium sp. Root61]